MKSFLRDRTALPKITSFTKNWSSLCSREMLEDGELSGTRAECLEFQESERNVVEVAALNKGYVRHEDLLYLLVQADTGTNLTACNLLFEKNSCY